MKKLILTSVCTLGVTGVVMAQGTVDWGSIPPPSLTAYTNSTVASTFGASATLTGGATGKASITTGVFDYELLYNTSSTEAPLPTTVAALKTWTDSGLGGVGSTTAAGTVLTTGQSTDATALGSTSGVDYSFIVVGWSANLGSSFSAVEAALTADSGWTGTAFFGMSTEGYLAFNAGNPGSVIFGTGTGEITSPSTQLDEVVPTPEPTTIALGVMGAASLLALRRKKA